MKEGESQDKWDVIRAKGEKLTDDLIEEVREHGTKYAIVGSPGNWEEMLRSELNKYIESMHELHRG